MNIVNGYMTEAEKSEYLMFESAELAVTRAILAYETFCDMNSLRMKDIELRCIQESATYDDLQAYYEAEEKENAEKKDGVIKSIWKSICNLFSSIKKFFLGDKKEELKNLANNKPNDEMQGDNCIINLWNLVKDKFSLFKRAIKNEGNARGELISWFGSNLSLIEKAGAITGATVAIKFGVAFEIYDKLMNLTGIIENAANDRCKNDNSENDKNPDIIGKGLLKLGNAIRFVCKQILKAVPKDKLKEKEDEINDINASSEGRVKNLQKKLKKINKEIEKAKSDNDEDTVKELESKKKNIEKDLNKAKRTLSTGEKKKEDINDTVNHKTEKNNDRINKSIDKLENKKKKYEDKISGIDKEKDADTYEKWLNKISTIDGAIDEFKKELNTNEPKEGFFTKIKNKFKGNKDIEDAINDEESTNESVEDILGFEIPESFIEEGTVEDDRDEILDLFNTLLN